MNLILVSAYFPPEVGSASHLYYELGTELVKRGHQVTILTGYPAYNIDQKTLPAEYRSGWWMKERMNGMEVISPNVIIITITKARTWFIENRVSIP